MPKIRERIKLGRKRRTTFSLDDPKAKAFRSMVDLGKGGASDFSAPTRRDALDAMKSLAIRDPRRLERLVTNGDQVAAVMELITYKRERHTTSV